MVGGWGLLAKYIENIEVHVFFLQILWTFRLPLIKKKRSSHLHHCCAVS